MAAAADRRQPMMIPMSPTRRGFAAIRYLAGAAALTIATIGGVATHQIIQSRDAAARHREEIARLETSLRDVARERDALRERYNEAVRRTAVTELVVADGTLDVIIRTAEGVQRRIETPFDPRSEIYVDYAILDGRLWIRRVFDAYTPPESGLVIDPLVETIDWDQRPEGFGKAVYRSLSPGRWIITVTGNGSLGLARVEGDASTPLTPQPPIRPFDPMVDATGSSETRGEPRR